MMEFFSKLFDTTDFPPRWESGLWSDVHGWLHVVSDVATFLAYAMIPVVLAYYVKRRNDIAFPKIFWLFAAFIFSCGLVHLTEAIIFWHPVYRVSGLLKLTTATVSWLCVIALVRVLPKALEFPSAAALSERLRDEIEFRKALERETKRERDETRLVLDTIPSLVIFKDLDNRILRTNRMMETFTGLKLEEIEGRPSVEIFPEMADKYFADDMEVVRSGVPKLGYVEAVEDRYVRTDKVPVRDAQGEITGILVVSTDVTEQHTAEELVHSAFNATHAGLLMTDTNRQIVMANRPAAKIFGYSQEQLASLQIRDLLPERIRDRHDKHVQGFEKAPSARPMGEGLGLVALHSQGHEFPVEVALTPMTTLNSHYVLASVVDVSQRVQREQELTRLTKLLGKTEKMASVGSWSLELATNELYWSDEVRRIHEVPDDFVPTVETAVNFYAPEWRQTIGDAVARGIETGQGWDLELELITAKGRRIWVRALGEAEREENTVVCLIGAFQDISERKHGEAELEQAAEDLRIANRRLDLALRNANIGLWDWATTSSDVYFSPTYKMQLGYSPAEPWNSFSEWEDRLHPDDHEQALRDVDEYFSGKTSAFRAVFRLRTAEDRYRWIESLGRAEFDGDNQPLRMTGVHIDITEQRIGQERLKQLNSKLTRSNEELRSFSYVASHDLRSPLRGIGNLTSWVLEDLDEAGVVLPETCREHLDEVGRQVKRMENLLAGLMEYARVGHSEERSTQVDVRRLVEETAALACSTSDFQVTLRGEYPTVETERSPLERVLLNLISNAINHHDDPPGELLVECEVCDQSLCIAVTDDGPGIEERHRERIFEIFQTLKPVEGEQASGLGLSIVKRTVEQHGGELGVRSDPPNGSTFWFTWPFESPGNETGASIGRAANGKTDPHLAD